MKWAATLAVGGFLTFSLLACQIAQVFNSEAGLDTADLPDATLTAFATEFDTPAASDTPSPTATVTDTDTAIRPLRPIARATRIATPRIVVQPTRSFGQIPGSISRPSGRRFGIVPSGARPFFGQITAVNGNQITIQTRGRNSSASTLTVDLAASTQFQGGSQSSLQVGERVAGYGTANGDGSITAEEIAINPSFGSQQ